MERIQVSAFVVGASYSVVMDKQGNISLILGDQQSFKSVAFNNHLAGQLSYQRHLELNVFLVRRPAEDLDDVLHESIGQPQKIISLAIQPK